MTVLDLIGSINLCLAAAVAGLWIMNGVSKLSGVAPDGRFWTGLLRKVLAVAFLTPFVVYVWGTILPTSPLEIAVVLPQEISVGGMLPELGVQTALTFFPWLVFGSAAAMALHFTWEYLVLRRVVSRSPVLHKAGTVVVLRTPSGALPFAAKLGVYTYIGLPEDLDEGQAKIVLRHEAMHIRRGDLGWNWLVSGATVLCAWNPFFWFWCKAHAHWYEVACDEDVLLRSGLRREQYLRCLVRIAIAAARPVPLGPSAAVGLIGEPWTSRGRFLERVRILATPGPQSSGSVANPIAVGALMLIIIGTASLKVDRQHWNSESLHRDTIFHLSKFKVDPGTRAFGLVMGY